MFGSSNIGYYYYVFHYRIIPIFCYSRSTVYLSISTDNQYKSSKFVQECNNFKSFPYRTPLPAIHSRLSHSPVDLSDFDLWAEVEIIPTDGRTIVNLCMYLYIENEIISHNVYNT